MPGGFFAVEEGDQHVHQLQLVKTDGGRIVLFACAGRSLIADCAGGFCRLLGKELRVDPCCVDVARLTGRPQDRQTGAQTTHEAG